jgi:hypothetical protein
VEEPLQRVHPGQLAEQLPALGVGERRPVLARLDHPPQPHPLLAVRDVLDLVGDCAAVRLPQPRHDVGQRLAADVRLQHARRNAVHDLGAQAVAPGLQRRLADRRAAERVELGGQVTVRAERGDQQHAGGHVREELGVHCPRRARGGRDGDEQLLAAPPFLGPQCLRDLVVEPVFALQQLVHQLQERAGFGALDDAVVVRAADRHESPAGNRPDRARRDDCPLPPHEARHGRRRADRARVRERDGGALIGVGRQLAIASPRHQPLVLREVLGESELAGALDHRHHQLAGAVLALDINGEAEVELRGRQPVGRPVHLDDRVVHHGEPLARPQDRPPDDVRERELDALAGQLAVQGSPHVPQEQRVDVAERGRGGDGERGLHVLEQPQGRAHDGGCRTRGRGGRRGRDGRNS